MADERNHRQFSWGLYLLLAVILYVASMGPLHLLLSNSSPHHGRVWIGLYCFHWPLAMAAHGVGFEDSLNSYVGWWVDLGK